MGEWGGEVSWEPQSSFSKALASAQQQSAASISAALAGAWQERTAHSQRSAGVGLASLYLCTSRVAFSMRISSRPFLQGRARRGRAGIQARAGI